MTTLLVASAGGHLMDLQALVDRLRPAVEHRTWVTYDRPDALEILVGEEVVAGYGPSTRHLGNGARNARLAWRLLGSGRFDRVVSTGAGIAVPFLTVARLKGIAAHYIECSTRLSGPSLSGRLLRFVPGVHLYTQSRQAADERWAYAGSVFDGFRAQPVEASAPALRVVVALGSHHFRFDALVRAVHELLAPGDEVIWQVGATDIEGLPGETHTMLPPRDLQRAFATADVVVCHAGVGLARTALQVGMCPVLVPRRAARWEHVDDHQVELAEHLAARGLAIFAEADQLRREQLVRAASIRITYDPPGPFVLRG